MEFTARSGTVDGPGLAGSFFLPGIIDKAVVPCSGDIHGDGILTGFDKVSDGQSVRYGPADTGRLAVRLDGAWLGAFKRFRGRDIEVTSRVLHDHALAFCFIPATLFDEE